MLCTSTKWGQCWTDRHGYVWIIATSIKLKIITRMKIIEGGEQCDDGGPWRGRKEDLRKSLESTQLEAKQRNYERHST